jgi:hypothetical protein
MIQIQLKKLPYRWIIFSKSIFSAELYFTFPGSTQTGLLCQVLHVTAYDAIAAALADSTVEDLQAGKITETADGEWICED